MTAKAPHAAVKEKFGDKAKLEPLVARHKKFAERFQIHHTTIQFETTGCETTHGCSAPPPLEAVGAHDHHHHSH